MDNIEQVVEAKLCTGCGTCVGVCPTKAIKMHAQNGLLTPVVGNDKCTNCRVCVRCCPGFAVNLTAKDSDVSTKQPRDVMIGSFLNCYVGHSNDDGIRNGSSSGGTLTQLLVYALEKGMVDGVLVVRWNRANPLEPEPFVARTREEIVSASRSKYCPVAMNTALAEILSKKGRYAVVGLPCHIHGIRKAEAVFGKLRERIVLHVGLSCGHTANFLGTELLLRKFQIDKSQVAEIQYRGRGSPGSMLIRLRDGREVKIRFNRGWRAYWNVFSPLFFTPLRCMMCPDHFNELSDVSVGDAWLPELMRRRMNESLIITRTAAGEELLGLMRRDSALSLRPVFAGKAEESQAFALDFKKGKLYERLSFFRAIGVKTPSINPEPPRSSSFSAWMSAFLAYASFSASSRQRLRNLLVYVPLPVFRLYFGLFRCLFMI